MQVAILTFEKLTALDAIGPYEVLPLSVLKGRRMRSGFRGSARR